MKFHDVAITDAVVSATGTIQSDLLIIAQGVTESERVGRKCNIMNIGFCYNITLPTTNAEAATGDAVRVILYQDKQTNGAAAAVLDILNTAVFLSFNNLANKGRFRILMDRVHVINSSAGAYDGTTDRFAQQLDYYTFYKKCDVPIEYNSTTGAITEKRSNNFGLLLLSQGGFAGFSSQFRFRFSDN